jgi:hypothetical protein
MRESIDGWFHLTKQVKINQSIKEKEEEIETREKRNKSKQV